MNSHPYLRSMLILVCLVLASHSLGQEPDTDGDGLLDIVDVDGFDSRLRFVELSIEDLDGANLLTNLHLLDLRRNRITSIESGDFEGLTNLQHLSLGGNEITSIERGAFGGLTNLWSLSLSDNRIASLERGDFEGLTHLQELFLSDNRITSIERGAFDGPTYLQELWLGGNQLTSIERVPFGGLTNLGSLSLGDNQITSIERGAFDGLTKLWLLSLSFNRITSIERGAFDGLTNLQGLFLSDNRITSIERGAFQGLTKLHSLGLWGNSELTELNLSQASFDSLEECHKFTGFCIDSDSVTAVFLDDAELSLGSFVAIYSATSSITDISLDGLTFNNVRSQSLLRRNLRSLLATETLDNVTVDSYLYAEYASEFDGFAAIEGNMLTIVSPDCNDDGSIDVADANCTSDAKLDRFLAAAGTYRGDLDGIGGVEFNDFLTFSGNFGMTPAVYTDGDFDLDSEVGFTDYLILAGNFGMGDSFSTDTAVAVPEPSAIAMVMCIVLVLAGVRLRD